MATVGTLIVKLQADISDFAKSMDTAMGKLQKSMNAALPASKMLLGGVTALAGAFGAAGIAGIKMAGDMEQTKIAFTTMLGSAEEADKFIRGLWDFAAKTPFEFEGLAQSSRQLLAFGFEAKEIIPMMTSIGDAVSALGGGQFEIERVTRALGQMQAKGKISAEEMMQLAELGIPAWQMLADAIGVSIPEAMDKASKGGIDATTGINAILAGMTKQFSGSMEQQSQTLLGLWSTAKDNVSGILRTLGQEIIDTFNLKEKLSGAITTLQQFSDTLTQFFDLVSQKGLRQALEEMIPEDMQAKIVLVAGAIAGALVPAIWSLASGIIAATVPLLPFIVAGTAVAGLAYLIYKNWDGVSGFFVNLWTTIRDTTISAWTGIIDFFSGLWGKLNAIWTTITGGIKATWDWLVSTVTAIAQSFVQGLVSAFEWMYNHNYYFQALVDFIRSAWNEISKFTITVWNSLKDTLTGIWDAIEGVVTDRWQAIQNVTMAIWTAVSNWLSGLWARIQGQVTTAWNAIYGVISGIWSRIREGFNSLVAAAWDWGRNLMNNFIEGFKSMFSHLWDALSEAADAVAGFLGFHSPTKLGPGRDADKWASNLVQMYAEGIQASLPKLKASLGEFALSLSPVGVVNVAAATAALRGSSTVNYGGITINIYGGSASDQADQLLKELARRGVKF